MNIKLCSIGEFGFVIAPEYINLLIKNDWFNNIYSHSVKQYHDLTTKTHSQNSRQN